MNICIIGTGASGWIACTMLKKLDFIKKITMIGSSKIPTIGVGESTTLYFVSDVLSNVELRQFVQESDAAVKYGVYYKNWGKKDFLHYFSNPIEETWENRIGLGNKDPEVHIHDLRANTLWNFIHKNQVSLDHNVHRHSWHFDAGKFINFLKKINLQDEKVSFVDDTIIDCKFVGDKIEYIVGENNQVYTADYFVNCCGDNNLNEKVFKEEYVSLSQYLLTNKALFYPLKYANKREQFHPYTVAKTMKYGWRWITPTQSRIGTGYVFSDNHISVDEATNELLTDIGDMSLEPRLVDFKPRYNKRSFKENSCTVGMANAFFEPLDAPGLSLTILEIKLLISLLNPKNKNNTTSLEITNNNLRFTEKLWCVFILDQYKTAWRTDTQFWIDHKNVQWDHYDTMHDMTFKKFAFSEEAYHRLHDLPDVDVPSLVYITAAKDIQWKSKITKTPVLVSPERQELETIHHLDYIQRFYD